MVPTPHPPLRRLVHLALTGAYVLAKWAASPALFLARRAGFGPSGPRSLDEAVNRAILPLTERPDRAERLDVVPRLRAGDPVPDVPVRFPDGTRRSLRSLAGSPLLLVLARGSWCSYARLHLADLSAAAPAFEAAGVHLLAVTSYDDAPWWRAHGVRVPVATDADGALFKAMGVGVNSWLDWTWGRTLPHESAFLFDAAGRLVAADVRRVSGVRTGQAFSGAERWLEAAATPPPAPVP